MNTTYRSQADVISRISNGKRILFATVPADGHVNPLTGIAVYLKGLGFDVRWYTSNTYADKLKKLNIPQYPLVRALDVRGDNVDELLPERKNHKSMVAKLNFDIINFFIKRSTEYFADIQEIYESFPFDLMIADCCFTAIPFVKEKMNVPVISMGIVPLTETSKDLPPAGLGMTPSGSITGRIKQSIFRWVSHNILFSRSNKVLKALTTEHNLSYNNENVFDYLVKKSTMLLQSGTPSFEYYRSDLGKNIRFVGPLLPHTSLKNEQPWFDKRLNQYDRIILVTQGTVERDVEKIIVPTLEAFKNTDVLVLATTGGSETENLRKRFPHKNIIIEDFIPFGDVMPYADVYVSNGGYGGVLLAIEHELPCVVAGIHEGKSEICARVGYFSLGINLRTETPQRMQLRRSVEEVMNDQKYKINVIRLAREFTKYDPNKLTANYINETLTAAEVSRKEEVVY